jgi:hypothetical protein
MKQVADEMAFKCLNHFPLETLPSPLNVCVFMPQLHQAFSFPVYVYFGSKMCLQNQLKIVNDQFPEY